MLTLDRADQAESRTQKGAEAVRTGLEMADLFGNLRIKARSTVNLELQLGRAGMKVHGERHGTGRHDGRTADVHAGDKNIGQRGQRIDLVRASGFEFL